MRKRKRDIEDIIDEVFSITFRFSSIPQRRYYERKGVRMTRSYTTASSLNNIAIYKDGDIIHFVVDLAGVDEKSLSVSFSDGILWIRGSSPTKEYNERYYIGKGLKLLKYELNNGVLIVDFKKLK